MDTTKKQLLALIDNNSKGNAAYIIRESNVIFPDVLCGAEEESLDYIEKFSAKRRAYIIRTYNRGKKYFPKVSTILNKYDLPHELKMLLALESAFNANAVSRAGAVGYWQFMDEVAREYGLKCASHKSAARKNQSKKTLAKKGEGKSRYIDRKSVV